MSRYSESDLCPICGDPDYGLQGFCYDCNPEDDPDVQIEDLDYSDFDDDDIPF